MRYTDSNPRPAFLHSTLTLTVGLAVLATLAPRSAAAQGKVAVVVENSSGKARATIEKAAPAGVVATATFAAAMRKQGLPMELGERITNARARGDLLVKVQAAGKAAGASMVVLGRVQGGKAIWLLVIDVGSGDAVMDEQVPIPMRRGKKRKRRRVGGGPDLGPLRNAIKPVLANAGAVASGTAAGGDTGGDTGKEGGDGADWGAGDWGSSSAGTSSGSRSAKLLDDDKKEEGDEDSSSSRRRKRAPRDRSTAFIVAEPAFVASSRMFSYSGSTTNNLLPYKALFVPSFGFRAEIYPAALVGIDIASDIGLVGSYLKPFPFKSKSETGSTGNLGTSWSEFDVGAKYRVRAGPALLGLRLSYGKQAFKITIPQGVDLGGEPPNVAYDYIRAGLDGRVGLDPILLVFGGAYRHLLSTGSVGETLFPNSSAMAFDVFFGGGYRVLPMLEVQGVFRYNRVGYSLKPATGAQYDAKSAADQLLGFSVGALLFF